MEATEKVGAFLRKTPKHRSLISSPVSRSLLLVVLLPTCTAVKVGEKVREDVEEKEGGRVVVLWLSYSTHLRALFSRLKYL